MRVIPVIDLMNGHVVRGVAGRRTEYRPIESPLAPACPQAMAQALVQKFDFETAYVADLDAIMRGAQSREHWKLIADAGLRLWLDAGVRTLPNALSARHELSGFVQDSTIIVGLESISSLECLTEILQAIGSANVAFSLDLNGGKPMTHLDEFSEKQPIEIVRRVVAAGANRLIVLDLADVGVSQGTRTLELSHKIRQEYPAIELVAGGGVRGIDDLKALADAGCDAALVASALHDGRLTPEDVREVEGWTR